MTSPEPSVTFAEAEQLQQAGEWVSEGHLRQRIHQHAQRYEATSRAISAEIRDADPGSLVALEEVLYALLASSSETRRIQQTSVMGGSLGYPLGRGRILKVGPTLRDGVWQSLGVMGSVLTVAYSGGLLRAAAIKPLVDETRKLVAIVEAAWERLTAPNELAVFDLIMMLQTQLQVVDYDALARHDYGRAYGRPGPSAEDIADAYLAARHHGLLERATLSTDRGALRGELDAVLQELLRRHVLAERHGRWKVAF